MRKADMNPRNLSIFKGPPSYINLDAKIEQVAGIIQGKKDGGEIG
jgi:hypothetical protein